MKKVVQLLRDSILISIIFISSYLLMNSMKTVIPIEYSKDFFIPKREIKVNVMAEHSEKTVIPERHKKVEVITERLKETSLAGENNKIAIMPEKPKEYIPPEGNTGVSVTKEHSEEFIQLGKNMKAVVDTEHSEVHIGNKNVTDLTEDSKAYVKLGKNKNASVSEELFITEQNKNIPVTTKPWEGFETPGENICESSSGEELFVITIILSSVGNFEARETIRETWGSDAYKNGNRGSFRIAFILARSANETVNRLAFEESRIYKDIIKLNILDDYRNLPNKSLSVMRWVNDECSNSQYVFKTDDDMYINVPNLLRAIKDLPVKDVIFGFLLTKCQPFRDPKSKWYVPKSVYSKRIYPDFVSGTAYGMPRAIASKLYHNCNRKYETEFPLEDVMITGICAERLGLERVHVKGFNPESFPSTGCGLKNVIASHRVTPLKMRKIWRELQNPDLRC